MKKENRRIALMLLIIAMLAAYRHYIEIAYPSDYLTDLFVETSLYWLHIRKV